MRLPASLVFLGLVAVVAALFAIATKPSRAAPEAGCGPTLVFLVWPKGHPAILRYSEFPEIRNPPHRPRRGHKGLQRERRRRLCYRRKTPGGITRGGFFTNCANYGDTVTAGTVAKAKVITKETAVKCIVKGSAVLDVKLRAKGVSDF